MNVGFFASEFSNGSYIGANGMFVFNGFGSPGISTYFPTFPNDPSVFAPDAMSQDHSGSNGRPRQASRP